MKEQEQKRIVYLSYFVGIIFSYFLSFLKNINFEYYGVVSALKASTILTVWWAFYFKIGWRIALLNRILYKINLSGTWYGKYESVTTSGSQVSTGDIVIRIKQSFLDISVISYTEKFINYSHSEELKYDRKSDINGLIYVYSQTENNPLDLSKRNGTAELNILKYEDTYKLAGEFWTIMGSRGKLDLVRVSKKTVDSFESGRKLYKGYKKKK